MPLGTHFLLVKSMPGNARTEKLLFFNFNSSVWMNTFCHTVCCINAQLNRQCCETHGIVII